MQVPQMTKIQAHFEDSNLELDLQKDENGHYLNEVARYAFMNWMTAYSFGREHQVKIANKAIEIALAEANAEQEPDYSKLDKGQIDYITPDEAGALEAGNAEYFNKSLGMWKVCKNFCAYNTKYSDGSTFKYRAIKPTCQVKNLDTGELKTMTREAAKLLQAETKDVCDWLSPDEFTSPDSTFGALGIYTYKRKANLVKLDGESMTREDAIALWESKKDTCDLWHGNFRGYFFKTTDADFQPNSNKYESEYQIREKPKKQATLDPSIRECVIALLQELNFIK